MLSIHCHVYFWPVLSFRRSTSINRIRLAANKVAVNNAYAILLPFISRWRSKRRDCQFEVP